MATATWFDYNAYMANKLVQVNAIDPKVQYTPETLKAEFEKAGYVGEEGAFKHFEQYGKTEDVAPNALFDADEYIVAKAADFFTTDKPTASQIAEVTKAFADGGMSAWDHYVAYGSSEGVEPSFSFNTDAYLTAKAAALNAGKYDGKENWTAEDVAAAIKASGSTVLEHFMANGGGGELEVAVTYKGIADGGVQNPYIDTNPPTPVADPNPGDTYPLTTKVDTFTGKEKDDVFNGVASSLPTEGTLNAGDQLDGAEGNNTLNVDMKSSFNGFSGDGKMANVQNVNLSASGSAPVTFSGKGSTGVETYNLKSTSTVINLSNLDKAGITVNVDGLQAGNTSIGFDAKAVEGTADALTLGLNNVGSAKSDIAEQVDVAVTANGIENLAVKATGSNFVNLAGAASKGITASGRGELDVTGVNATLTSFDASTMTGNVTADLAGSTLSTVKGGAGNDTFTVTSLAANAVLAGGAGNDTLVLKGVSGLLQPSISGFETVKTTDGGTLTLSGKNSQDFSALQVEGSGNITLSSIASKDFVVTASGTGATGASGTVTTSSAGKLTFNIASTDEHTTAKTTNAVTTALTASEAGTVAINVGAYASSGGAITLGKATDVIVKVASSLGGTKGETEMSSFASNLTANKAKTLTVDAQGNLGAATIAVGAAETVTINAAKGNTGGAFKVEADNALTLNLTAGKAMDIKGSTFDEVLDVTLTQNNGKLDASNVNFGKISSLTVNGAGTAKNDLSAVTVGTLGSGEEYGITVTASGLKGGFQFGDVETLGAVTLNLADVTGAVSENSSNAISGGSVHITAAKAGTTKIGTINTAEANKGMVVIDATGLKGGNQNNGYALDVGVIGGSTVSESLKITFDGGNDVKFGAMTAAKTITLDASGYMGVINGTTNATVADATIGALKAETIVLKGSEIGASSFTGMTADNLTFTGGLGEDKIALTQLATGSNASVMSFDVKTDEGDDTVSITTVVTGKTTLKGTLDGGGYDDATNQVLTITGTAGQLDMSGLTIKNFAVDITGSTAADILKAGDLGGTITGGSGADTITLGAGADTVVIASTATTDADTIIGFNAGASNGSLDVIHLTGSLGGMSGADDIDSGFGSADISVSGSLHVLASNAFSAANSHAVSNNATIASAFADGTNKVDVGLAIIDSEGNYNIWYVTGKANGGGIDTIELIGTIKDYTGVIDASDFDFA